MKSAPGPIVETRSIETRGGSLVIEMTQAFIDRIKSQFDLGLSEPVTDDHLKTYLWGAVSNAVEKATDAPAVNPRP